MRVSDSSLVSEPSHRRGFRRCVFLLITFHLLAVGLSLGSATWQFDSIVAATHAIDPYLRMTQFGLDDRPISLTDGEDDQAVLSLYAVETSAKSDTVELLPNAFPGSGADDRQQRFLASIAVLVRQDQPSLVSELLTPIVEQGVLENPNLSEVFISNQTYHAIWLKSPKQSVLVHQPEPRLLSQSVDP